MSFAPDTVAGSLAATTARANLRNRVSWGAVFAGISAALVIQILLNMLGIGIGASSLDAANLANNPSASAFSMSAAIWVGVSALVASLAQTANISPDEATRKTAASAGVYGFVALLVGGGIGAPKEERY